MTVPTTPGEISAASRAAGADDAAGAGLVLAPEYYETVYPSYDRQNPPYKYAHYLAEIRRFRPVFGSIGDIGCADGRFLEYVLDQASPERIIGADVNAAAIDRARTRLGQDDARRRWVVGGPQAAVGGETVDVLTALDCLEHIESLDEALQAIDALLSPGGLFIAVVPVYDGPLGPLVHWLDRDPTHVHKCSRAFWLTALRLHFDVLRWHGILRYLLPAGGPYLHAPTRWGRAVTPAILIAAQKRGL
ncbi:MAG: class I SAM-dependent methyltransferase [Vampirovibrionales bacterium]|nr:class I SAM-dependent methyltransferase [Vampirovibrionales bacterium]